MKKIIGIVLILVLVLSMFVGCANNEEAVNNEAANDTTTNDTTTNDTATTDEDVDAVTTASIVSDADAFVNALSANGTWIAATLNDITLTEDLVVEGEFMNKEVVARKIALYTQDADRNITAEFTLTAPKMIIKSENTKLHGGVFVGDIYVEANGFSLDKTVEVQGNVYFATKENLDTFTIAEGSAVTGIIQVEGVDVVTSASLVTSPEALVKALSADGTWIVAIYSNMNLASEIVVDGEFISKEKIARKLALYTQDADRNITASFTLKAPKMTVKSENFKIQGGTFAGDVYVEANGFQISNGSVDGNVYFASQEYMDSFIIDEADATVTGSVEVK